MTFFPARDQFDADDRPTRRHAKVYRYLRWALDFRCERTCPLSAIEKSTGVSTGNIPAILNDMVEWGYLHEYARDKYRMRVFTLTWSCGDGTVRRNATRKRVRL